MPNNTPSSDKNQSSKRSDKTGAKGSRGGNIERSSLDNRHIIRQMIVQALYLNDYKSEFIEEKQNVEADFEDTLGFYSISPKIEKKLRKGEQQVAQTVQKIRSVQAEIDEMITKHAPAWPLSQINKVDLQILRLAIWEGFVGGELAPRIAIDEAIELARDFGTESNIKFVSGVLGSIYSELNEKDA